MSAREDFPWTNEAKNLKEGLPAGHKRDNQTPTPKPVEGEKEDKFYPGQRYQKLFDHMAKTYNLTLLQSEMDDIISLSNEASQPKEERDVYSGEELFRWVRCTEPRFLELTKEQLLITHFRFIDNETSVPHRGATLSKSFDHYWLQFYCSVRDVKSYRVDELEWLERILTNKEKEYWQKRCEAAELVIESLRSPAESGQENFIAWQQLKSQQP